MQKNFTEILCALPVSPSPPWGPLTLSLRLFCLPPGVTQMEPGSREPFMSPYRVIFLMKFVFMEK